MKGLACVLALSLVACGEADTGTSGTDGPPANTDGDCLSDAEETEHGTDPSLADSDGDGIDDCDEIECVSDPADATQQCYACGWPHGDPGTFVATGADDGDVIENLLLVDQCTEDLRLWDLAGSYVILMLTTPS